MRTLRAAAAVCAIAALPVLGGCASTTLPINTAVTRNTLYGVTNSYGVALAGANTYKGLCKAHVFTYSTCRPVVVRMQAADAKAEKAIASANAFIKQYPTVDASNVISAAQTAVASYSSIVSQAQQGVN